MATKTYDYTITSLTTSYREELVNGGKTECWLVAHAAYTYGTGYGFTQDKQGSCDAEVYLIATKTTTDGVTVTSVNGDSLPTRNDVLTTLKEIIEKNIASEIQEMIYLSQRQAIMGNANVSIDSLDISKLNPTAK